MNKFIALSLLSLTSIVAMALAGGYGMGGYPAQGAAFGMGGGYGAGYGAGYGMGKGYGYGQGHAVVYPGGSGIGGGQSFIWLFLLLLLFNNNSKGCTNCHY